jgi:exonuclease III
LQNEKELIDVCFINTRSVNNKTIIVKDYIVQNNTDICALTETWLRKDDDITVGDICPNGFKLPHQPPTTGQKGGGVGLLHRKSLNMKPQKLSTFYSFEYQECFLKAQTRCVRIIVLYRPPPSDSNSMSNAIFLEEFAKFLEQIVTTTGDLLVVGDFNFPVENKHNY